MLLVAVAIGSLLAAVLAVVQPTLPTRIPPVVVWVAAAAGAVALAVADTAPTGWQPLDLVLRAGFGALVPLAASRAGTVATAWLGVVATAVLLVAEAPAAATAGVATGALLALAAAGAVTAPVLAVVAAAALGPLAHADWPVASGASAVAVAAGTAPLLLIGLARTRSPYRGRIALALTAVVVVAGLSAAAGLVAAFSARTDIDRAVDLATDGLDRLGDDDDRARADLLDAAGAFASAEDTLTTWWARPALLVPGVAQQTRAVTTMASAGADLARTAADATAEADVDSIRPIDGRIDLEALAALAEPLDRSVTSLRRADARLADVESPLLLGLVAERLTDLRSEVDSALASADLAAHAVEVAPRLLGADGPRRYFLAFQNPSEIRGNGGFIGNWAELVIDDGQMTLARNGRSRELFSVAPQSRGETSPYVGEDEVMEAYAGDVAIWGRVNMSPDHPTTSRLISQLYPQSGGTEVDGVIALSPAGLAGFLELTGPVELPGYPEAISSENVERILLHEQYLEYPRDDNDAREAFLGDVVDTVFGRLTSGELPGPRAVAEELGAAVAGRNLQLWSSDEAEQGLFARLGATGDVSRTNVDTFGVVTQNLSGNKIDWFQHREVEHDVTWDPRTGEVAGTITVRVRNDAPSEGLPDSILEWSNDLLENPLPGQLGLNRMLLSIYSAHEIVGFTIDGEPAPVVDQRNELGHQVVRADLLVPPESVREVVAYVRGVVAPSNRYVVQALRQPAANPDQLRSTVRVAGELDVAATADRELDINGRDAVTWGNALEPLTMTVQVEVPEPELTLLDRLRGRR